MPLIVINRADAAGSSLRIYPKGLTMPTVVSTLLTEQDYEELAGAPDRLAIVAKTLGVPDEVLRRAIDKFLSNPNKEPINYEAFAHRYLDGKPFNHYRETADCCVVVFYVAKSKEHSQEVHRSVADCLRVAKVRFDLLATDRDAELLYLNIFIKKEFFTDELPRAARAITEWRKSNHQEVV